MSISQMYRILGVSPYASDEEIKRAYRNLAKKYHPDRYADSPLAQEASEKMKEINNAYDAIMQDRKNNANASCQPPPYEPYREKSTSYHSYQKEGSYQDPYKDPFKDRSDDPFFHQDVKSEYVQVRLLIGAGKIKEAEMLLNTIPSVARDADWYYFMGLIALRKGRLEEYRNYIATAYAMNPTNEVYKNVYESVNHQRKFNRVSGYGWGGKDNFFMDFLCDACNICCDSIPYDNPYQHFDN